MDKSFRYKIFTDPVHGFINVPKGTTLKLVDHPYLQRLRRIRQLGLGYLVFPGAEHSRFSHALGAMGLMQRVLNSLREKDTTISYSEYEGTLIAILLHDIGHGPFSHTLEHSFIRDFNHEMMTLSLMHELNQEFDGALDTAIAIFTDQYPKKFLHQLISSQLDIDRMDYLKRDSTHTGVYEGSIGVDRIIKTMRVHKGNVVIERKGIYAIENYIIARRLMYMQVYLHKTVLSADKLLLSIFNRVRFLMDNGEKLYHPSPSMKFLLEEHPTTKKGINKQIIHHYTMIDDSDVLISIKYWLHEDDPILADLCRMFLNRRLFRTRFLNRKPGNNMKARAHEKTSHYLKKRGLPYDDDAVSYYLFFDYSQSEAYKYQNDSIWILDHNDHAIEFSKAADTKNIMALTQAVVKNYMVYLKGID
jgi:HD superfamily phosphohydrolase